MLVQLKCENCASGLTPKGDGRNYFCESCGAQYILVDKEVSDFIRNKDDIRFKGKRIVIIGNNDGQNQESDNDRYSLENYELDTDIRLRELEEEQAGYLQKIAKEKERERLRLEEVEKKAYRIRNKLCRHCGGPFEGRLFKTCSNCGKHKDY